MAENKLIETIDGKFEDYLKDESRFIGKAKDISFPNSVEEVNILLDQLFKKKIPVTIQGARTGITGAAVPTEGGHILNFSKMNAITGMSTNEDGSFSITVEPGVLLSQVSEALEKKSFDTAHWSEESKAALELFKKAPNQFFPPDPTETSATIGGMLSCNAQGINAYYYGGTADYIQNITINFTNGQTWILSRDKYYFDETGCNLPGKMRLETGQMCEHPLSRGIAPYKGMDLLDLFAGSEGMLGVITSITLRLIPEPEEKWGILFFFQAFSAAMDFVKKMMSEGKNMSQVSMTAIELFDKNTLDLVNLMKKQMTSLKAIPDIAPDKEAAVYIQLAAEDVEVMEDALLTMLEAFSECGGGEEDTWAATGSKEIQKLMVFRHSIPEAINMQIDRIRQSQPEVHKMGADFSMPTEMLDQATQMYQQGIKESGLTGFIFGHVGSCHLHVNLLPETMEEYKKALILMEEWAKVVVESGGKVAEENGVGKIKRNLLMKYISSNQLNVAKKIKSYFDPDNLLNPGNMF